MKICLDPGHGGNDSGAVGLSGLTESSVALAISLYVKDLLKAYKLEVKMTREKDEYISLATRCTIANSWGADYFVSIHLNSDGPTAIGIETLYASDSGKKLAQAIQEFLIAATGDIDRGLKHRDNLYVLNGTNMPAALAETGFISHPAIEAKFKTYDYRTLIADAIAEGIIYFLDLPRQVPQTPPA